MSVRWTEVAKVQHMFKSTFEYKDRSEDTQTTYRPRRPYFKIRTTMLSFNMTGGGYICVRKLNFVPLGKPLLKPWHFEDYASLSGLNNHAEDAFPKGR